jgi:hypothetical protein
MDDTKTLSIPGPDGVKLRARPLNQSQMLSLTMLKRADFRLAMETMVTLFESVFGPETYREFVLRLARGEKGSEEAPQQMIELLNQAARMTVDRMKTEAEAPADAEEA